MTTPDNTPAFPSQLDYGDGQITSWTGMTLRDYFAAKAMQGYIVGTEKPRADVISRVAYEVADVMMGARK